MDNINIWKFVCQNKAFTVEITKLTEMITIHIMIRTNSVEWTLNLFENNLDPQLETISA